MNDIEIIKKYEEMSDLRDNTDYEGLKSGFISAGVLVLLLVGLTSLLSAVDLSRQTLAVEIYEIQTGEFSCSELQIELKKLSKYYTKDIEKKDAVYDKLVANDCMSEEEVDEIIRNTFCNEFRTVSCRIDAIKNPIDINRIEKR